MLQANALVGLICHCIFIPMFMPQDLYLKVGFQRLPEFSNTRSETPAVRRYLRELLAGRWQKVIKQGNTGEVHYFEHVSGQVAGVKYFSYEETS